MRLCTAVNFYTSTSYATEKIVERLTQDTTTEALFTVTGRVMLTLILGEVTTANGAAATTLKLQATPSVGLQTDVCAASAITSDDIGTLYSITGTFADSLVVTPVATGGVVETPQAKGIILTAGTINSTAVGNGGKAKWVVHFYPIDSGSNIVPAYSA